jgi:hypothetical protein
MIALLLGIQFLVRQEVTVCAEHHHARIVGRLEHSHQRFLVLVNLRRDAGILAKRGRNLICFHDRARQAAYIPQLQ